MSNSSQLKFLELTSFPIQLSSKVHQHEAMKMIAKVLIFFGLLSGKNSSCAI